MLRSGEMTEQAAERRLKELAALKMHPREMEMPHTILRVRNVCILLSEWMSFFIAPTFFV